MQENRSKNRGLIKLYKNLNEVTCGSFCIIREKSATVTKISSGILSETPSSTLDIPLATKEERKELRTTQAMMERPGHPWDT
jgi:hypothetical protein